MLFGADGQVGRETIAATVRHPSVDLIPVRRTDADLGTPGAAAALIRSLRPTAVVNAAAWTAVDKAETQIDEAFRINAHAVAEIADACREARARFIHISTDYVFSGETASAPLAEDAPVGPINIYGASKLQGENLARDANPETVVLRTSWVYSVYGANFVKTMLKLAETRSEISVVEDQKGGPTAADAIAHACLFIAAQKDGPAGLFHFQGAPPASWADFAEAIFAAAVRPAKINRISTGQYPTPAKRPLYTVLNCSKIERDYGLKQPDWRPDIVRTVRRLQSASD